MSPIPKTIVASLIAAALTTAPLTQAAKPGHAGDSGKPAKTERAERQSRKAVESDRLQGTEKQRVKKAEQQQKELGKGSEQGQESRETHRRKWWRFWE